MTSRPASRSSSTMIREADALLIATPEFNTAMPGQLKHLVDWGSRPYGPEAALYGKPVAVIGASKTDYGGCGRRTSCARRSGSPERA